MTVLKRALVACALALAACSGPAPTPSPSGVSPSGVPAEVASWPLALYAATEGEGGFGALVRARLVQDGQCVYLVSGRERWLPMFPWPGTHWDGSSVQVHDTTIPIGSETMFGGGESDLTARHVSNVEWVKPPAAECLVGKAWWIYFGEAR